MNPPSKKGLEEIAFTDHYECLDFGKPHSIFTSSYLTNYQNTLDRCQEQFSGRLTVKRGLELGQMYLTPESSAAVLSRYPWDYVIGSVHKLHNTDLSGFTFTQDNLTVIAGEYYSGSLPPGGRLVILTVWAIWIWSNATRPASVFRLFRPVSACY